MTPAERIQLAEALSEATGQTWRPSGEWLDPSADGATRTTGERISVLRVGGEGWIEWLRAGEFDMRTGRFSSWETRRATFAGATGRGWLPRFVAAAVPAIAAFDAVGYGRPLSARDRRRAEVYRRLLAPDSGAAESERMQAAWHLARMGEAVHSPGRTDP